MKSTPPLYELVIDAHKRPRIQHAKFQHSDFTSIQELQTRNISTVKTNEFRYIGYDKEFLETLKPVLLNAYKKRKFCNIIQNYFETHHVAYTKEESNSGSVYYKFKLPTFDKSITVRLSDHQPNKICACLAIRYDKYNIANKTLVPHVEGILNKLLFRKSLQNAKEQQRSKE